MHDKLMLDDYEESGTLDKSCMCFFSVVFLSSLTVLPSFQFDRRERLGMDATFNIGFSTYTGTVTAAKEWDTPGLKMNVTPGMRDSFEELFHEVVKDQPMENFAAIFRSNVSLLEDHAEMNKELAKRRLERFIGVIYRPDTERQSHYSRTHLSKEYDALIYLDRTNAVEPLDPVAP
jgi:erythromycin esterase-like protein